MSTDKLLQKIQSQIDELAPTLELFVDDTIQPSVADCEQLQKILSGLQENIAVYKYNKQNKELSPSFNIHAKLSAASEEKEKVKETKTEMAAEIKETVKLEVEEKNEVTQNPPEPVKKEIPKNEALKTEPVPGSKTETVHTDKPKAALAIGLNDKFRFMNEMFGQNSSEYNIAIEQINNLTNWNEGEIYLNSLKNVYDWDPKDEVVKQFFALVKKRFD
jgi:hypothetical protein